MYVAEALQLREGDRARLESEGIGTAVTASEEDRAPCANRRPHVLLRRIWPPTLSIGIVGDERVWLQDMVSC